MAEHGDLEGALAELIGRAWGRDAEEELRRLGISPAQAEQLARARQPSSTILEVSATEDGVALERRER